MLGSSIFAYDSFLNAGILEWGFRSILSWHHSLFDWTAGFPLANSLAVGENLIGWQFVYAPLRELGVGILAAYNTLIFGSLLVSAVGAALLARRLGAGRMGAAAAGLVFGFGPFHLSHLLHIQTMGVCWTPFAILFLDRYLEGRSPRDALGLAASFVISALCSMYFGIFLGLMLPLYAVLCWIFRRHSFDRRALGGLVATGAFAAAILMPLISHYLRFNAELGYHHDAATLANFSMELAAPLRVPDWQAAWAWSPLVKETTWRSALSYTPAFPGLIAITLAIYAVVTGRLNADSRPVTWLLVSLAVICYLLALGPVLKPLNVNTIPVPGWVPMPGKIWLHLPGIRWPMRMFFFAWLAGAILCGLGLTALERRLPSRWRRAVASCAILLIAIEYWPKTWLAGRSVVTPGPMALSDAYPYVARESDRGGIVELPTSDPSGWRTPFSTRYIYASSGHLRRVVALHGSVTPPVTDTLMRAANALPDTSAMNILASHGVTRVIVHPGLMRGNSGSVVAREIEGAGYPLLFAGREGMVFATMREAPASPTTGGQRE